MIELDAERMAAVMGADLLARGEGGFPRSASIDSRTVAPDELFFGLTGTSGDGGRFAGDALAAGAWGVVTTPGEAEALTESGHFVYSSEDPLRSMQMLARAWRRELGAKVIGVTGSVGKTSVKDITRAILPGRVHASEENFNTEIGLPLTVLAAPAGTEILVLEMAMRGTGQIAELAEIAEPDVAVITNVGPVHVELLGSIEAVAAAKAELIGGLRAGGTVVASTDAGALEPHLQGIRGLTRFGPGGTVELGGFRPLPEDPETGRPPGTEANILTPEGEQVFDLPFTERHNLTNTLAAVAAGLAVGARPAEMAVRSAGIAFSKLRGERIRLGGEAGERGLLLNDCYNANPISMRAALEHLAAEKRPRKVAVLGLMAELGPESGRFHHEIGDFARELGIGTVIGVGETARSYRPDQTAADTGTAADRVRALLGPDTVVLIKGSRAAGLEAVAESLVRTEGRAG
ncbi:MAG: UDP-N-acetylmuramoyl-tripeptide--D-alanyl-D-alanine ligase [Solirubrobacterales bacterium]|nr:UDP-N-acetylmuramoyl-tripeptide--D-alanyl-D-alanine ligase [Solirubrobacterales bacterium]